MAKLKFDTILFAVWHATDYSRKFEMELTAVKPRKFYEVRDPSGKVVGQGYTADEAMVSLAKYLNVGKDEICYSRMVVRCRKDAQLVYEIRVEGEVHKIFSPNGIPIKGCVFDTYKDAHDHCVEILS